MLFVGDEVLEVRRIEDPAWILHHIKLGVALGAQNYGVVDAIAVEVQHTPTEKQVSLDEVVQ